MKKITEDIESSPLNDIIKSALNYADNEPYAIRGKIGRFMNFLKDSEEEFSKEEIINYAMEFYNISHMLAHGIYHRSIEDIQENKKEYRKFFK